MLVITVLLVVFIFTFKSLASYIKKIRTGDPNESDITYWMFSYDFKSKTKEWIPEDKQLLKRKRARNFLVFILLMTFGYEKVVYVGLDPEGASASGINVSLLNLALSFTTALVIVSSMSAVGVILVIALLSTPTLLGLNKAHSLRIAMMRSSFFGLCISLLGFILSIVFNLSPGPAISVICVASLLIPKLRK